jgi:hypothetical protein
MCIFIGNSSAVSFLEGLSLHLNRALKYAISAYFHRQQPRDSGGDCG